MQPRHMQPGGKLGTTPLVTIIGAMVGAAGGFYSLYLHLVKRREGARRNGPPDDASGAA